MDILYVQKKIDSNTHFKVRAGFLLALLYDSYMYCTDLN